ncbi:MAG: HDOD domain-containing protein [Thermoguttaceae bacterium]|jgi:HD-like signal output (HDOD) protein
MANGHVPKLELKKILSMAQLPGLPQSAIRLLELSQDPANGPAEFAAPIEVDPGLTGQVLRFVNSSYFGFAREISSVKMAITLVGIRTIKNFALWSAVFSLMANPKCGPFDLKSLWQDSLRRALFARALAKILGMKEAEDTFAAALLQDMAVPVLAKESPQVYTKLLESRKQGQIRLSSLEDQVFGWNHAQAGGMMARHWNLPEDFAHLIENHTEIEKLIQQTAEAPDKAAVSMSALLPAIADPVWIECQQFESYYEIINPGNSPTIMELLSQIDREFEQLAPLMKISTPAKSLADCYNDVTTSAV